MTQSHTLPAGPAPPSQRTTRTWGAAGGHGILLLAGVTAAAAALVALIPQLAAAVRELLGLDVTRRAIDATAGEALSIGLTNAIVVGALLLLVALAPHAGRVWQTLATLVVGSIVLRAGLLVGAAIGAYGAPLLAHMHHLPFEWAAVGAPAGVWLFYARHTPLTGAQIRRLTAAALTLLAAAALTETFISGRLT